MQSKSLYPIIAGITMLCTSFHCSNSISGVETTNGFTVVATSQSIEGTAPAYAQIFLFDTSYVPYLDSGIGLGTAADDNGHFRFAAYPGAYNVLVVDNRDNSAGILSEAVVPRDNNQSKVTLTHHLAKTGSISGVLSSTADSRILIYLSGLCYYRVLTGSGQFTFTSIPPGTYYLCCAVVNDNQHPSFALKNKTVVTVETGKDALVGEISIE